MKTILLSCLLPIITVIEINAQNYLISFTGTGASTTVTTVKVENITAGTSLILSGNDILRLTTTTGIDPVRNGQPSKLKIYPNPMTENSIIQFSPLVAGDAIISIFDMVGKPVAQMQSYLEKSMQEFKISGLKKGMYIVNIKGGTYQFTEKIICNGESNGAVSIVKRRENISIDQKDSSKDSKGVQSTTDMAYNAGDRLKFTATSGIYSTVKTDIPTSSKTIEFNFIGCTDGDNNNYPIVEIGTQIWMAENLKTSKLNDGTIIPIVTDNTGWSNLDICAYCNYNNTPSNNNTFGKLYNWFAVNTRKLCPVYWHAPSDAEWSTLAKYLGGESVASAKLKETNLIHWTSPNTGAIDEVGFTALPGGVRNYDGLFGYFGSGGFWWSSTEANESVGLDWSMFSNSSFFVSSVSHKTVGESLRCLKDQAKSQEALITSSGGTFSFFNDSLVLNIPANAVENPTEISIRNITNDLPEDMKSQIPLAFEFLPDGLVFKEPVQLVVKVPESLELDESAVLAPFNINTGWAMWHESEVDLVERTISTEINHFSNWSWSHPDLESRDANTSYSFNLHNEYLPANLVGVDLDAETQIRKDISRAFIKWQAYTRVADITFLSISNLDPSILVMFMTSEEVKKEFGVYQEPYDGAEGVVMWNNKTLRRRILLNDNLQWHPSIALASGDLTSKNIERVVNHELGHFLRLNNYNENTPESEYSVMGGTSVSVPLSICAIDLQDLKRNYPKINNITAYKVAKDLVPVVPTNTTLNYSPGQTLNNVFQVRAIDETPNGIPNVTTVFRLIDRNTLKSVGSISNPVYSTNEMGYCTLESIKLPDFNGQFVLSATIWVGTSVNTAPRACFWSISTNDQTGTVIDIENNVYKTVEIGTQTWMAENLKTTKFNDGTNIPYVPDAWAGLSSPGYCWQNNDIGTNKEIYGAIYNWHTVNTGKLCPNGWHIPSDEEWTVLTTFLGGPNIAGGLLKETGTVHWSNPNIGATNESGFTALPGGSRTGESGYGSGFSAPGLNGLWWSTTPISDNKVWRRYLTNSNTTVSRDFSYKFDGLSVRCIKDASGVNIPTNGLVAYYPFNGNANDESGNGNNGTVSGATLTTDRFGMSNQAYNFNTANETKITISPFSIPSLVTISIWFYPFDNGPLGLQNSVLLSNHAKFVNHDAIDIIHADGKIIFRLWNSSGTSPDILSNDIIQINSWHHLVCQVDELNNIRMYLDGKLQSQTSVWSGTYSGQTVTNIGNYINDDDNFDGVLDDIRIYNRALTQQEIVALYNE